MGRQFVLSFAVLALAVLVLAAIAGHVHPHGQKTHCTLCQTAHSTELPDIVSLLETPQRATGEGAPSHTEVNLTLAEVDSSMSLRGPPA